MHASYKEAIEWIAHNDDEATLDTGEIAGYLTTCLVADLWRKHPEAVAEAVYRKRIRIIYERGENLRNEARAIRERLGR